MSASWGQAGLGVTVWLSLHRVPRDTRGTQRCLLRGVSVFLEAVPDKFNLEGNLG